MGQLGRRSFLKVAGSAGLTTSLAGAYKPVRVGVAGVGNRGSAHVKMLLDLPGVEIPAICDIDNNRLDAALTMVVAAGRPQPEGYARGPEDYLRMVARNDLDAVITATPWDLHTPVAVAAMKAGKYAGTEVPAATTLEQCWQLVNTSEQTGVPCMLLENDCYGAGALMALNLVEQGVLGEIVHCEGGYEHDIRSGVLRNGELSWRARQALRRNGDLYPTHPVGPIAWWTNINRGDRFAYLTSMASKSRGRSHYIRKYFGENHLNASVKFALGDVVTTLIRSVDGVTVVLSHDTSLPRPQSDSGDSKIPLMVLRLQGTEGIFAGSLDRIYIEGPNGPNSKMHKWQDIAPYYEKYGHPLWKAMSKNAAGYAHGGEDYICVHQFIAAVRNKVQTPIDVYDAATWSAISQLSEQSIAGRSIPVDFPDFTRGKWKKRRRIAFIL